MECQKNVVSEEFADFIMSNNAFDLEGVLRDNPQICADYADSEFTILYVPMEDAIPITTHRYKYYTIPNLYTLLDTSSLEASGIMETINQPVLNLRGQGTIIGFVDTGIDYQNPLFRYSDGRSRILGIWDQNLPSPEGTYEMPPGIPGFTINDTIIYGTEFTNEQINQALASDQPLSVVPSIDEVGHGTFLAGIAAGSESKNSDFIGVAPDCNIAVVKLKKAKKYLREFYAIQDSAVAYQENDIMMGIKYLALIAARYEMPLVVCIGLGTNLGSHEGSSPLGLLLRRANLMTGFASVIAGGNEVGRYHHFLGNITSNMEYEDVELLVGPDEKGFVMELWATVPETYTVGFVSPGGQVIQRLSLHTGTETLVTFTLENTQISVHYGNSELGSGSQFIVMRFLLPAHGIWRIRVYNTLYITGRYHMWLPVHGFITENTVFLNPDPFTTITEPANAYSCITAGAYNHRDGSLYIHTGYGYSRDNILKPSLTAPGVDVYGPALSGVVSESGIPMTYKSGTSVAAAHVAGAAADLMTWGIVHGNNLSMNTAAINTYLLRGADRTPAYSYPNQEWGMGALNLYQTILRLRE